MKLPWKRTSARRKALIGAGVALGVAILALPLMPSLRRYALMESM